MIGGLNAGFGDPLGGLLPELHDRGVQAIRQGLMPPPCGDLRPGFLGQRDTAHTAALVAEFETTPIQPFWLTNIETMRDAPSGADLLLLNEPKLHGWSPSRYAEYAERAHLIAMLRQQTVWYGSLPNLASNDLAWLRSLLRQAPHIKHVEVHWYPREQDQEPWKPKPGHRTIHDQFSRLLDVLDGRAWICGEYGIHQAQMRRGWFWNRRTVWLSEADQRDRLVWMRDTLAQYGCTAAFVYQLNDGPRDEPEHRRGIRTVHERWKLAADPQQGVFV